MIIKFREYFEWPIIFEKMFNLINNQINAN